MLIPLLTTSIALNVIIMLWLCYKQYREHTQLTSLISEPISQGINQLKELQANHVQQLYQTLFDNQEKQSVSLNGLLQSINTQHENSIHRLQSAIGENYAQQHKQLHEVLGHTTKQLHEQFQQLLQSTERHMLAINESMEAHLSKGFEKTNETFTNIIKRLAIIDDAQKKITDLSQNVVSLQDILKDKRSRGAFGEIQLKHLIENILPSSAFSFQYLLSTGARADCILFLPRPTHHIVIDAKFPLENFQKMTSFEESTQVKAEFSRLFKQDIKKHIQDISTKYIIPDETSEGAIMFIPAEAVFAEIHAHYPELVEYAHEQKVWMTSPTTLMAILTTVQSVLKDDATREQIHVIQKHLKFLAQDFDRFEKRMDNLSKHLQQANLDAEQVHTSAKKIAKKFTLIENVELSDNELSNTTKNLLTIKETSENT